MEYRTERERGRICRESAEQSDGPTATILSPAGMTSHAHTARSPSRLTGGEAILKGALFGKRRSARFARPEQSQAVPPRGRDNSVRDSVIATPPRASVRVLRRSSFDNGCASELPWILEPHSVAIGLLRTDRFRAIAKIYKASLVCRSAPLEYAELDASEEFAVEWTILRSHPTVG